MNKSTFRETCTGHVEVFRCSAALWLLFLPALGNAHYTLLCMRKILDYIIRCFGGSWRHHLMQVLSFAAIPFACNDLPELYKPITYLKGPVFRPPCLAGSFSVRAYFFNCNAHLSISHVDTLLMTPHLLNPFFSDFPWFVAYFIFGDPIDGSHCMSFVVWAHQARGHLFFPSTTSYPSRCIFPVREKDRRKSSREVLTFLKRFPTGVFDGACRCKLHRKGSWHNFLFFIECKPDLWGHILQIKRCWCANAFVFTARVFYARTWFMQGATRSMPLTFSPWYPQAYIWQRSIIYYKKRFLCDPLQFTAHFITWWQAMWPFIFLSVLLWRM